MFGVKNKIEAYNARSINKIPEPTRSLLWITDENPSKAQSAMGMSINISIDSSGEVKLDEEEKGLFAEPSLIWTQLPIQPNQELRNEALYWPSYIKFNPKERFQYLSWLTDVTKETNLSYVFLYFYGLERHLLTEKYDEAVTEILRLLKYHDKSSFRSYATRSLIVASIINNRPDILERAPYILTEEIDEALALRIHQGTTITAEDVTSISSRVGFKNKRYIKLYPSLFQHTLQGLIDQFESDYGKILSIFDLNKFRWEVSSAFANLSIPKKYRKVEIPKILSNAKFKKAMFKLLQKAHDEVKAVPKKKEREAELLKPKALQPVSLEEPTPEPSLALTEPEEVTESVNYEPSDVVDVEESDEKIKKSKTFFTKDKRKVTCILLPIIIIVAVVCCVCSFLSVVIAYTWEDPTISVIEPSSLEYISQEPELKVLLDCSVNTDKLLIDDKEVHIEVRQALCGKNGYLFSLVDGENIFTFTAINIRENEDDKSASITLIVDFNEEEYNRKQIEAKVQQFNTLNEELANEIKKYEDLVITAKDYNIDTTEYAQNLESIKEISATYTEADDISAQIEKVKELVGTLSQNIEQAKTTTYTVLEVVDGDTIKIDYNGTKESIRLIGIDTPETKHPTEAVQCYGQEATDNMKSLVEGKQVTISFDNTQGVRDKYGRLLLYVWVGDVFVNQTMISEGYAYEYTYNTPYKYQQSFKQSQQKAQDTKVGLWGDDCNCSDKKGLEESRQCVSCQTAKVIYYSWDCSTYAEDITDTSCTNACPTSTPRPTNKPIYIAPTNPPTSGQCKYSCSGPDRNCSDFTSHNDAQTFFNCCGFSASNDPMRLDGNNDGVACENS